ncbi:MAG: c-type cytochrome, partial [Bacteroidia bacterium]|nr:c-type cytochrome [Bacteroidia bacterium]
FFFRNYFKDDISLLNSLDQLQLSIKKSFQPLRVNNNADKFDRLGYITKNLNPLYKNLAEFHIRSGLPFTPVNYAINFKSTSLFEKNSFNKKYFSVGLSDSIRTLRQTELGKILFFDPVLSGNNKRACASCHQPGKGLSDGLEKSMSFEMNGTAGRNAPTLYNVAWQKNFFYDGRAFNLEEQASAVMHNQVEMNATAKEMVEKLKQSDDYLQLFRTAFKGSADTAITFYGILKSIAEFERTLDSRNSRFDKYLRGDHTKLNAAEKNGYNLFAGKALCGSCHFFPLFNGLVPPSYADNEFEVIGAPEKKDNKNLDQDTCREKITRSPIHRFAFKTPTVRNAELTAPYMHNGAYNTLDEVIEFYNKGGGAGLKFNLENQTLPFDSLQLSKKEMKEIKLFLLTLTDTSNKPEPPLRLPFFKDEKLNKRKSGGEY